MPGRKTKSKQPAQITSVDRSFEESQTSDAASSCVIVGIGASAGGLEAVTQLLRALPPNTGMAFALVQHLDPTHSSMLTDILSRATTMRVMEVENQMAVEPNCVYVIPPGTDMMLSGGLLQLSPRRDPRGHHRSIDYFFRSLAQEQAHKAIGVILSGIASDGTLGLQAIKAEGGITFAQDDTAQQNSMPHSAITAGCVDFVLPPDEIAKEIARISRHPYVASLVTIQPEETARKSNLGHVLKLLLNVTGVDFNHYKHNTLYRRITRRMVLHKLEGLNDYVRFLEGNSGELDALYQDILISVTSFFRNPETFEVLKTSVFPKLVKDRSRHDPVRVWVLGCSTGEETYSMAISLAEFAEASSQTVAVQIFATDLNGVGLEKARRGLYSKDLVQDLPTDRLRRFFIEVDGQYQVTKSIRDMCIFARHNVLADPPFSNIDLISCRNLLIYLEPVLQERVLPILHYALKPNGFLCLGASETIGTYRELFEVENPKHKIYVKKPTMERVGIDLLPLRTYLPGVHRRSAEPHELLVSGVGIQREADRILLAKYAPAGVLVNSDLEILQFRGDTGPFLAPAPGKPSLNILKMLREGLLVALRAAVLKAKKEEVTVRTEGLRVKSNGGYQDVNVEVVPVKDNPGPASSFLILFEEPGPSSRSLPSGQSTPFAKDADAAEQETTRLKQELAATREYLQSVIEQQEASNEELQSANEEVQSANEELQSINEELETSKEEIQSSNEELATLNEELQHRNLELSLVNNDLVNLFSGVQMAIVMLGADLHIRRFTPTAERILNLIPTDVGRPISDIQLTLSLPDLRGLLAESIDTVSTMEQEVQDKQGRWYLLRIIPYKTPENKIDGAVIVLVDVDDLKRNQENSRRQVELLDQTWEPIFVWDSAGTILYWNKGAEETYGFTKEQAIGQISQELLNTAPRSDVFKEALEEAGRWTGEIVQVRRDGKPLVFDSRMTVVRDPGGKWLVIQADHPITERKEREDVLRQRAEELARADRNRNEFLAMLAHELRNPLAPLRNAIEVLRLPVERATSDQAKEIILRQVQNLARMVNDLLDVSRVTQRKITLSKQPVELMAILKQVTESYHPEIEKRSQNLSLTLVDHSVYVDGDATRLEQIFGNLLSNAIKYTSSSGHIWLTAKTEPNAAAVPEGGQTESPRSQVVVRVRDDGIGLSPEILSHVFELFMQSNRSLDRAQGGLGIGLTLVKELVELHGGTVEAHSEGLDRGSEFVVCLPALSMAILPEAPRAQFENAPMPAASRRVLVVDDNEDEARSLAMFMQLVGHEVQVAHDGPTALEITSVFQPDVVLLDIGLPGMNGFEVASQLCQKPELEKPYLIAVTGYGQEDDRRRAKKAGFDYHFTKPIEPKVLQNLIRDFPPRNRK